MTSILNWLERYGRTITFQQFSGSRLRAKNRVLLAFVDEQDNPNACGGPTLVAAITKAQLRNRVMRSAGPEPNSKKENDAKL